MVKIRLQRVGRKNQASFRLVVTDSHNSTKSGKSRETLGSYSPHTNLLTVEKERVLYWMGQGAQVSDTVRNLLIREGILQGRKVNVLPRKSPVKSDAPEEAAPQGGAETAAPAEEAPAAETPTSEAPAEAAS